MARARRSCRFRRAHVCVARSLKRNERAAPFRSIEIHVFCVVRGATNTTHDDKHAVYV